MTIFQSLNCLGACVWIKRIVFGKAIYYDCLFSIGGGIEVVFGHQMVLKMDGYENHYLTM